MRDIAPAPDHDIELSGGALALDFANTVGGTHVRPTHDHLRGYDDILRFAVTAGGFGSRGPKRPGGRGQPGAVRAGAGFRPWLALRGAGWGGFSSPPSGGGAPAPV